MARGKDASLEYDAPEGHRIVEFLNYTPAPSYTGQSNIHHLIVWSFMFRDTKYQAHFTDLGARMADLLGPIIGLDPPAARKRSSHVKKIMEGNGHRGNFNAAFYQSTRGQGRLVTNAAGVDHILYRNIGPQAPIKRREEFTEQFGTLVMAMVRKCESLASKPIKRPKAGSRDYAELLAPAPRPLLAAPKEAPSQTSKAVTRATASNVLPPRSLPTAAASLRSGSGRPKSAAAAEPEPSSPASNASSPSPPKPKRRRLRKVTEALALDVSEKRSEGSVQGPVGAGHAVGLNQDSKQPNGPQQASQGGDFDGSLDLDAGLAASFIQTGDHPKSAEKEGSSFPDASNVLTEELPPVAAPPMAVNPAVNLRSAVGATGNVIGDEPLSPGISSHPPVLDPLPANSSSPSGGRCGAGAGSTILGGSAERHVAARGKENSPPGGNKGRAEAVSAQEKRSMATQTSPGNAGLEARTNQVLGKPEDQIVTGIGGTREGFHTAGEPHVLSVEGGHIGGVLSDRGGARSTAADGRAPSLPGSIAPRSDALASISAGRGLTSAEPDCLSTGGFDGVPAAAGRGSAGVSGAVGGAVSGAVSGAETGPGVSTAGKRKRGEKAVDGEKEKAGNKDECGCSAISEADFAAYEEVESRAKQMSHQLIQAFILQQPEHERQTFLRRINELAGYGCVNLVRAAPPSLAPMDLIRGPLRPVIAALDYVVEHIASVVFEAPSQTAIEAAMRRDTETVRLYGWQANLSETGLHHFQTDKKRPGLPLAKDTPHGLYTLLRHNTRHRKKCRQLVPRRARFSLGWPSWGVRQWGTGLARSSCSLYWGFTRHEVNDNYDLIAAAEPGPADDEMEEQVRRLEHFCNRGQVWELQEALRGLQLGSVMECTKWR